MRYLLSNESEQIGRALADAWNAGDIDQIFHVTITPTGRVICGEGMRAEPAALTVLGLRELTHVNLLQANERRQPNGTGDHYFEVTLWLDLKEAAANDFNHPEYITARSRKSAIYQ